MLIQQEEVRPPRDAGTPPPEPTPGDVERTPPSFAGGSRIFDIENPEALARDVGAKDGDGATQPRLLFPSLPVDGHCVALHCSDETMRII